MLKQLGRLLMRPIQSCSQSKSTNLKAYSHLCLLFFEVPSPSSITSPSTYIQILETSQTAIIGKHCGEPWSFGGALGRSPHFEPQIFRATSLCFHPMRYTHLPNCPPFGAYLLSSLNLLYPDVSGLSKQEYQAQFSSSLLSTQSCVQYRR